MKVTAGGHILTHLSYNCSLVKDRHKKLLATSFFSVTCHSASRFVALRCASLVREELCGFKFSCQPHGFVFEEKFSLKPARHLLARRAIVSQRSLCVNHYHQVCNKLEKISYTLGLGPFPLSDPQKIIMDCAQNASKSPQKGVARAKNGHPRHQKIVRI